ncbi:RHS repeat protein [Luteimonas sp. XNQY3]|nr:RHS repeat protein [Luteimonas sp. XNQY3]MCD9004637.1 RHS repeat protein [Luteimonas sp. XNQY3]
MQPYQEYDKRVKIAEQVAPLSSDLFGEQVNMYDRSAAFEHVDISIPGNFPLPVELRRSLTVRPLPEMGARPQNYGGLGNWDISVPYITGTFDFQYGWNRSINGEQPRCSTNFFPHTLAPHQIRDIFSGYQVSIPGQGSRGVMAGPNAAHRPDDGQTRLWTTRELDSFSCVPMASGYPGEGFLMVDANGVKYRFDVGTVRQAGTMAAEMNAGKARNRIQVYLLASRVEDSLGNWVNYSYNAAGHPISIEASDGRRITLAYSNGALVSAAAHGRQWSYGVQSGQLVSVSQPDGAAWGFAYSSDMSVPYVSWDAAQNFGCSNHAPLAQRGFTLTLVHPAGATGRFAFGHERHYRSGVSVTTCIVANTGGVGGQIDYRLMQPNYFDKFSLMTKAISGPGLPEPLVWSYSGNTEAIPLWSGSASPCTNCVSSKTVEMVMPDGSRLEEDYGLVVDLNEGRLLGRRHVAPGGAVLREELLTYVTTAEAAAYPFPNAYGAMFGSDDASASQIRPLRRRQIVQQEATFTWEATSFDVFARPLGLSRSSSLAGSSIRTEVTQYHDNLSKWILGQQARQTVNGVVASETSYDTLARPTVSRFFGKTVQTLGYNADGTIATVKDGGGNVTSLSGWKRGVPQTVRFAVTPEAPGGATRSALVNDAGWVTRITDENGFPTNYGYDTMGRLASIGYPSGDSTSWNTTMQAFEWVAGAEYGIPGGHWRQTVATGNGRMVRYFDALWRPLLTREYDSGNATATQRFQKFAYDHDGRVTFASYPSTSSAPAAGTWSEYDALGRPTAVAQDSELGLLTTTTAYLSGFQTRVTSPKGMQTTTGYMAWDQPTTEFPISIAHPAGVFTDIARDAFGKPTAITRRDSSGGTSLTRRYTYDANQLLCRSLEPETGATLMGYDGAGNLAWSAAGLPAVTACHASGNTAVILPRRTSRIYDARNRLQSLTFPDNLGNTDYTYTPDGQLAQVVVDNGGAGVATTVYTYNRRRMLTGEAMGVGDVAWGLGYGFDANGHLARHVHSVSGLEVDYSPNALGQPTRAGSYATGASYFPNGALKQFTYGNGVVHTLAQNARGLPDRSRDAIGSAAVYDDSLDYDAHGNVAAISDGLPGNRGNRTMQYDALDRLTQTVSPMFGTASYGYDVLDNLRTTRLTAGSRVRNHTYVYDAANRLTTVTNTSGSATVAALGYDAQGNLATKGGQAYQFDFGNRLRSVPGLEQYRYDGHGRRVQAIRNGRSLYSIYGQDGVLRFQRDELKALTSEYIYLGGSQVARLETPIPLNTPVLGEPGYSANGSYTVNWTSAPFAVKYQLQESANGGGWATIHDAAATSKAITGKPSGTYGYRVRACSAATCGCWSATVSASVLLPPTAVPSLTAPTSGPGGVYTVSWTNVAAASRYELEERLGAGGWTQVHAAAATTKAFSGKAAGSYGYRVRGCNTSGCAGYSAISTVQVVHVPASAPALTAPATSYTGSYSVTWTAVATSTRYELQQRSGTGAWSTVHNAAGMAWSVPAQAAGNWGYQVRACNATGCSAYSAARTTAVTLPPAASPALTVPATNTTGGYTVSWGTVASATSYRLEERLNGGAWSNIHNAAGTSRAITGKGTGAWGYRAQACNVAGCSGWTAAASVTVTRPPTAVPRITNNLKRQWYVGQRIEIACSVDWTQVENADRYELKVPDVTSLMYSGPETSVAGRRSSSAYCASAHQVRACNVAGCSTWSSPPTPQALETYGTPGGPGIEP